MVLSETSRGTQVLPALRGLRLVYRGHIMHPTITSFNVPPNTSVFTIDVEDWFHIMDLPAAPSIDQWQKLPSLVERNFYTLLDLLDRRNVKGTCFFLGWSAERSPQMVREAVARGHEVASHGYGHDLVYDMSPAEFLLDLRHAKSLLEDLAGRSVEGYRAPGFSVTAATPWFFEKLAESGHRYSSSVFPAARQHGGMSGFATGPCAIQTLHGPICEFPISVAQIALGKQLWFFGGGYLRLFPYGLVRRMAAQVLAEERPLVFYIHPREIDPTHPRLAMPLVRRLKSYIGLRSTKGKLDRILSEFSFKTFSELVQR